MNDEKGSKFSRRSFLKGLGSSAIGTAAISTGLVKTDPAEAYTPETSGSAPAKKALNLKVNGKHYKVDVEQATSSIRCRKRLSNMTDRSVAFARRVRLCPARRC